MVIRLGCRELDDQTVGWRMANGGWRMVGANRTIQRLDGGLEGGLEGDLEPNRSGSMREKANTGQGDLGREACLVVA